MQSSPIILVTLLSALAFSAPSPNPALSIKRTQDVAAATMQTLQAAGCNAFECVSALAGETAACAAAAAELGADPIADIACFASVTGNLGGNACAGCF